MSLLPGTPSSTLLLPALCGSDSVFSQKNRLKCLETTCGCSPQHRLNIKRKQQWWEQTDNLSHLSPHRPQYKLIPAQKHFTSRERKTEQVVESDQSCRGGWGQVRYEMFWSNYSRNKKNRCRNNIANILHKQSGHRIDKGWTRGGTVSTQNKRCGREDSWEKLHLFPRLRGERIQGEGLDTTQTDVKTKTDVWDRQSWRSV